MANILNNIFNLEVGDVIVFTNKVNYKVEINVKRVEEKSWYGGIGDINGRNSYGTLKSYSKYPDFKIIKK
jgi:flagellar motor switch protein FliM